MNSMENVEAKELTYTTHGHDLKGETVGRRGYRVKKVKGEKKWDNCKSIIKKFLSSRDRTKRRGPRLLACPPSTFPCAHL